MAFDICLVGRVGWKYFVVLNHDFASRLVDSVVD